MTIPLQKSKHLQVQTFPLLQYELFNVNAVYLTSVPFLHFGSSNHKILHQKHLETEDGYVIYRTNLLPNWVASLLPPLKSFNSVTNA